MKTNSKFTAWLLVALALVAGGQRDAAVGAVGYINVTVTNGYNLLATPLRYYSNSIHTVLPSCPVGTQVYVWDMVLQQFGTPSTYTEEELRWDMDYDLPLGMGFLLYSPAPARFTITFVGEVAEGRLTNVVAGGNRFSLLGSKVPQSLSLSGPGSLEFPGGDGDNVFFHRPGPQTYSNAWTFFNGFGWFDPKGVDGVGGPVLNVGQGFFVQNRGLNRNWIRTFPSLARQSLLGGPAPPVPQLHGLTTKAGEVTLSINNTNGAPCNIQFSTDMLTWTTVATNQTGLTWTGPYPGGVRGYYEVVNP